MESSDEPTWFGIVPLLTPQVWQGIVKDPAFTNFRVETCRTVEHAQQVWSV
jgi:hypothetical protein